MVCLPRSLVLPVVDQILDHRRVGKRRDVAQVRELVLRDLAQDAAHDLARARLGQARRELDQVGRGDGADLLPDVRDELLAQVLAPRLARVQRDVAVDALALEVVRVADDGGLGDLGMGVERALDLRRAEPVARHVDHVVDASGDPVVAVLVAAAAVAGEVHALVGGEVGLHEALVIAEHASRLPRPAVEDDEVAGGGALEQGALLVDERGLDAEERLRRRAGLQRDGAGQRRDENAARLRLPPGVDDGAALFADHVVVPLPGFRIDRLADGAQEPQRGAARALDVVVAGAHQRADRGRRGVEDVDAPTCRRPPRSARAWDSSERPRTSTSSRRWRAARRRCSCGR